MAAAVSERGGGGPPRPHRLRAIVTALFTVTAAPAAGVNVVRRVSLSAPFLRAARPRRPRLHVSLWVEGPPATIDTRHQVVSLRAPVVARWVILPAPDTVTLVVIDAPVRVTFLVMIEADTVGDAGADDDGDAVGAAAGVDPPVGAGVGVGSGVGVGVGDGGGGGGQGASSAPSVPTAAE